MRYFKISILSFLCLSAVFSAQALSPTDTSDFAVQRIRNIISSNREVVNFIEYTFAKKGIPKHMRNLALIESGFNQGAVSYAGASGIWQLMPQHANHYGLHESNRDDIYKSTQVAATSLANLYKKYNDWITVVAAYNCGEGNIAKAMQTAGSKNYAVFYPHLPTETINHVKKFINACYATGELEQLSRTSPSIISTSEPTFGGGDNVYENIDEKTTDPNLVQSTINNGYDLDITANFLGTSVENIMDWNPNIQTKLNEKGETAFFLPGELMGNFEANRNKILKLSLMK